MSNHFENKEAIAHVVEKRVEGIVSLSEAHGTEIPGHISAGADAMRETALLLGLIALMAQILHASHMHTILILIAFSASWLAWKIGRSAWLGWARLERLHRLIEQEKYEIEHHRSQEREELKALYQAKGFEGRLLDEVVDTLMADQDRLLKVMLEEELGLTLQAHEHPLKQAFGAAIGVLVVLLASLPFFLLWKTHGLWAASALLILLGAVISAHFEGNKRIPAIVWNLSLATLSFGILFFLIQFFVS
jgi:vacuolar iron transporter family protein